MRIQPRCERACLLSDKYTSDTIYVRTDTLWKDYNLCGKWLDSIKVLIGKDEWLRLCDTSFSWRYEVWRYVIGNEVTWPHYLQIGESASAKPQLKQ